MKMNLNKAKKYVANLILQQTDKYTLIELMNFTLDQLEELSFQLHREGKKV